MAELSRAAHRLTFWHEVIWRPVTFLVLAPLGLLGLAYLFVLIRDEFLPPEYHDRWRLLNLLRFVPWHWWIIATLVILVVIVLEGSYRFHRRALRPVTLPIVQQSEHPTIPRVGIYERAMSQQLDKAKAETVFNEQRRARADAEAAEERLRQARSAREQTERLLVLNRPEIVPILIAPYATGTLKIENRTDFDAYNIRLSDISIGAAQMTFPPIQQLRAHAETVILPVTTPHTRTWIEFGFTSRADAAFEAVEAGTAEGHSRIAALRELIISYDDIRSGLRWATKSMLRFYTDDQGHLDVAIDVFVIERVS